MTIDFGEPERSGSGAPGFGTSPGYGMPPAQGPTLPAGVGGFPPAGTGFPPGGAGAGPGQAASAIAADQPWGSTSFVDPGFVEDQIGIRPASAGKPPLAWLVAAVVVALVAGGLALWFRSLPVIIACWVFAGPVAVFLLAQFRTRDQAARAKTTYLGGPWVTGLAVSAGVLILAGVGLTAFAVGRWVAYA